MAITSTQLFLYFGALVILFITPGPVWIAIIARTVSGGVKSALSLTLGVSLGDLLWPIIVFLGLGLLISVYADILILIRYLAALILAIMGMIFVLQSYLMGIVSVTMASILMILELFVAFLQAYIFAMLTSVFIGLIRHAH